MTTADDPIKLLQRGQWVDEEIRGDESAPCVGRTSETPVAPAVDRQLTRSAVPLAVVLMQVSRAHDTQIGTTNEVTVIVKDLHLGFDCDARELVEEGEQDLERRLGAGVGPAGGRAQGSDAGTTRATDSGEPVAIEVRTPHGGCHKDRQVEQRQIASGTQQDLLGRLHRKSLDQLMVRLST